VASAYDPNSNHFFNREARQLFEIDRIHNELGFTGEGITVSVLDTGIYHFHPRFARYLDETGRIPGWDFVDNDDDPMEATYEKYGPYNLTVKRHKSITQNDAMATK